MPQFTITPRLVAAGLVATLSFPVGAHADTPPESPTAAGDRAAETAPEAADALPAIVVTAQRREENLQDVPVAVTALTGDQLEMRGVTNLHALNALAPNLQITRIPGSSTSPQIGIRGSMQTNGALLFDQSVGVYLDGVFISKAVGGLFDLADLERIEVLRGPQGTLYGRNTLAGAVNLVTRQPSGTFGGEAGLDLGRYDSRVAKLSMDLPKVGIMSARLAVRSERRDGWVDVVPDAFGIGSRTPPVAETNDRHSDSALLTVAFDPAENFTALYRFDVNRIDQNHVYNQLTKVNPAFFGGFGIPLDLFVSTRRETRESTDVPMSEEVRTGGHSLTLAWDLGDALQLKSISAYRELEWRDVNELDGSPFDLGVATRDVRYHAFSQELQALGHLGRLDYVTGLYYSDDHGRTLNPQRYFGLFEPFGFASIFDSRYGGGTEAQAAYAQLDFAATERLTLTAGLRYSREKKTVERYLHQLGLPAAEIAGSGWRDGALQPLNPSLPTGVVRCHRLGTDSVCSDQTFSDTTPSFTASFRFTEAATVYARYAEGFRSGGFNGETNLMAEIQTPYEPEKLKAYELGAKTSWLDGRATLNAAVFQNESSDMQVYVFLGGAGVQSVVRNAGEATVRGFELESALRIFDGWLVQASYGHLDGEFDEYIDNVGPGGSPVNVGANRAFPHAPKHTLNLSIDGRLAATAWGEWRLFADYAYVAENYFYPYPLVPENPAAQTPAGDTLIGSHGLLNARLALTDIPVGQGRAEVALWGQNLTDEDYVENRTPFGPTFGDLTFSNFGPPRMYGAQLSYRW